MKKLFVFFVFLALGFAALEAQTVIKEDQTRIVTLDTMLITGETVNFDYYGKDFFENSTVQILADTATGTGTGDVVLTVTTNGSLDYSTFFPLDTIAISGSDRETGASGKVEVWYDYLRYAVVVAGTGDSVEVTLNFLFDINQ